MKNKLGIILIGLAVADLLGAIDATGVNIALPTITKDLAIPIVIAQWIPNAYTLVLVVSLIFMGKLGDIIGAKKLYTYGLIIFGLASVLLGFLEQPYLVIAVRALQGLGTAILYTMPMAIIAHLWQEREKAFAVTASFFAIGMLIGPFIGGVFAELQIGGFNGWHLLFLMNVPLILIGLWIVRKFVPELKGNASSKMDYLSLLLLTSGLVFIVSSLSMISRWYLVLGVLLLLALYFYEKNIKHPLLDFSLFKNRTFVSANLVSFFTMVTVVGMSFVLTFYLQDTLRWSSFSAGLALLPVPIITGVFAALGGKVKSWRLGALLSGGLTLAGILVLTQVNPDVSYYRVILPGLALIAAGSGFLMTVIFAAILGSAPTDKSGNTSGILNTLQQLGGLIGVALVAAIVLQYKLSFSILAVAALVGFISAFWVRNAESLSKDS